MKDRDKIKKIFADTYIEDEPMFPTSEELDQAVDRVISRQKVVDELKTRWRLHLGLSVKEFDKLDLSDVYKDIDNYGIEKLLNDSSLTKDTLKVEIEALESIRPETYIIPNNKLSNVIAGDTIPYNAPFKLALNKTKTKVITNQVTINYEDENIELQTDNRLTPYDRTVHNAVCSILEAGNTNFTPDQVYRCMNGMDNTIKVSPQSVGAVTKSIDKSRKIYAIVDYTNEAEHYKKLPKDTERLTQEDYILSAKKTRLEAGGHVVEGYKINAKPLLYEYAQFTNQVISVPSKLLQTHQTIRSTPDVIVIREYLIRRIEQMKHPRNRNMSNKIKLQTVFEEIGEHDIHKKKAATVRNTIDKLLTLWKKDKYIIDFNFYKKGRTFQGVEIQYQKSKR